MTDIAIFEDNSIIKERYECAIERIREIGQEKTVPDHFAIIFRKWQISF